MTFPEVVHDKPETLKNFREDSFHMLVMPRS